jgi:superfamily II DNA/RNA helicase
MSFKELGVNPALVKALVAAGIEKPFPIQKATLPDAISGKDILGRGQTGSGKTLAFGLALMTRLAGKTAAPMKPLGLVLSPTRELAMQISDVIAPLSRTVNLNSQVVAGGLSYSKQIQALKRGVPIVVATPGRLIDLINKKHIKLDDVQITILDEADQMADMGFLPDVKKILDQTKPGGQRMLFSATLDRDVDSLVKKYLKNPVTHSLANEKSTAGNMTHHVLVMEQANKDAITASIAARKGKSIFFVRTKHGADKLAKRMNESGVAVGALHGGKTQAQRSRVLEGFKMGKTNALVATDVAARGIHVDDVSLVVHVDAPENHKDYLHRAGRTARAGAVGTVVTLSTHKQVKGVRGLAARAGVKLVETKVGPMDQNLVKITGAIEPSGIPIVAADGGKGEKSEWSGRSRGGYGDSRSRGGGKKKKSRPRPNERRKRPR